jgi:hypothetical protein
MSGPAWQALTGLPAWEITQIPRRDVSRRDADSGGGPADRGAGQRLQALAAAYRRGAPVAFGWVRDQAGGPVRVIAAGHGLAAAADDSGEAALTLPAGARARPLHAGEAARAFAALACWTPLPVVADALLSEHDDRQPGTASALGMAPPSLEDGLLSAWTGPFAWLVLADPVGAARLGAMTSEVVLAQLGAQRHDSPRAQLAARRTSARHTELRRAAATGLWDIRLLAAGATPDAAAQVAGLLCASADLDGLPYALALAPGDGDPAPEFPVAGSTRLLAALARPPAREVPGILFTLRPDFDVTPERTGLSPGTGETAAADGGIPLGEVLDQNRIPAGTLTIPLASLNRHVFVCGATGAGKSQSIRHLLESAANAGIGWLVIEPAKAEYRLMAARLPGAEVVTIRPGDLDAVPAGINPLEPAAGPDGSRFPLQAHADLVRALFMAAFEADEPFPQVLAAALTRCYEQAGWDLVTGEPAAEGAAYPSLADLQAAAMTVVEDIGYGREITDNVRGFVRVRIGSLRLGTTGRFLDGGFPLDFAKLLESSVVLEIEDCGDDTDKAFLTGAVLIRLTEHLRMRSRAEGPVPPRLRHLTVVEEAHRLLRQPPPGTGSGPAAHAVEMFAGLLAEIRAYGEGLVIAEQIPAKLISDVIKNTAVKIVHRLPAKDDRDTVGATMNLTEQQSKYLVTLVPGEAAVFTDGMDYPILARMPDGTGREAVTPLRSVSPATLTRVRSPACPAGCEGAPCTLRQMRAARNAASRDPRITLWAELSVAGHLAGWAMPMPGRALAGELAGMRTRLRDCALAQAADDAVASRVPAFAARVSGPALAGHVAAAMRAAIDEDRWECEEHEPRWHAPAVRQRDGAARRAARRDLKALHVATFGNRAPSAIEQAAGTLVTDPDWDQRMADALAAFPDCAWILERLRPPPEETWP